MDDLAFFGPVKFSLLENCCFHTNSNAHFYFSFPICMESEVFFFNLFFHLFFLLLLNDFP